jgi:hypothetical protein
VEENAGDRYTGLPGAYPIHTGLFFEMVSGASPSLKFIESLIGF